MSCGIDRSLRNIPTSTLDWSLVSRWANEASDGLHLSLKKECEVGRFRIAMTLVTMAQPI